jgi:hypothetical protein
MGYDLAYEMNRTTDPASNAPIATLNIFEARSVRRKRWSAAPNASQTKQLGRAASTNSTPKATDCSMAPASAWR